MMETAQSNAINNKDELHPSLFLTADFKLILHTKIAQSLFNGDWRQGRIGVIQFAALMTRLSKASREDDPYAELFLLKTYEIIQEAKETINAYEDNLKEQLSSVRGFQLDLFKHPDPLKLPLRFTTPFGFMGAMLIEQVDYVNRQLFTLHRIGLIPVENLKPVNLIREIQSVFQVPRAWKLTGVTRKDISENNQKALNAKNLLGELPEAVLNKDVQFIFLPKPKGHEKPVKAEKTV